MKRLAAHYLFLPEVGFMKQQVVETDLQGTILTIFPLTEEVESVEWFPGVIALIPAVEFDYEKLFKNHPIVRLQTSHCFFEAFDNYKGKGIRLFPFLFYPFDFISMQPVAETQHRLLR